MPRRTRGQRIATGVYRDAIGVAAIVTVKQHNYEKRFPPDTPLELIQAWQSDERAYRLRCAIDDSPAPLEAGSLAADVKRYLQKRVGRDGYKADRSHLAAWTKPFGQLPRHKLTKHDCERQIGKWLQAGRAPKTIRHRARVLKALWRALDGAVARSPVDGLKLPPAAKPAPVAVDHALIRAVAKSLQRGLTTTKRHGPKRTLAEVHHPEPSKTYARFLVYALCGQRPAQIMRTTPADLDFTRGIWYVKPAKHGHPIPLPMNLEVRAAWETFAAADAWGKFNSRSFSKTLRRHGWPTHLRPKALRATFAIDHLLAGTPLETVQGLLGHTNIKTTRDYYAPVLLALLEGAVGKRQLKLTD